MYLHCSSYPFLPLQPHKAHPHSLSICISAVQYYGGEKHPCVASMHYGKLSSSCCFAHHSYNTTTSRWFPMSPTIPFDTQILASVLGLVETCCSRDACALTTRFPRGHCTFRSCLIGEAVEKFDGRFDMKGEKACILGNALGKR